VRRRRAHVDVVVTDCHVRDHAQPAAPSAGVENAGVDPVGEQRHDRVAFSCVGSDLLGRIRRVVDARTDEFVTRERIEPAVRKTTGDEHPAHARQLV
jgi:hypothetical protein